MTFNHTVIIGRLGKDPEMITTANGTNITTFSLSNHVSVGGKEETQWHMIKAFGRQAQVCTQYLKKGDLCCVEGHLDIRTYEKEGTSHKSVTIVAERVVFLQTNRQSWSDKHLEADNPVAEAQG